MKAIRRLIVEAHRRSLWQVFTIYAAVSWGGYQIIDALPSLLGVPDWVPGMSVVLFLIGLPIVLATAFVQEGVSIGPESKEQAKSSSSPPGVAAVVAPARPSVAHRLFTWKRAMIGAGLALLLLTTSAAGYVGVRNLGWGPWGSLRARGDLSEEDILILADFGNATPDSTLSDVITEALRIDLSSSRGLKIAEPGQIEEALTRMRRGSVSRIDRDLAHEIAEREQLKAVIAGEVGALGSRYVLTAEIYATSDRRVIAQFRETARDADALLDATERLARSIRKRAGESLQEVNSSPSLARVTTRSLPALRKFTEAVRAGGGTASIELLEEAIALDSTFAMAYRTLGAYQSNAGRRQAAVDARSKAFELRETMTAVERALTEADYYRGVDQNRERALRAYREALAIDPQLMPALNNAAFMLNDMGRFAEAESLAVRALGMGSANPYSHLTVAQYSQRKFAEVLQTADLYEAAYPQSVVPHQARLSVAVAMGDSAKIDSIAGALERRPDPRPGFNARADLALMHGQLRLSGEHRRRAQATTIARGGTPGLRGPLTLVEEVRHGLDAGRALRQLDSLAVLWEVRDVSLLEDPIETLGLTYAVLGRMDRAREYLARAEARLQNEVGANPYTWTLPALRARVALAEGRGEDALRYLRQAKPPCDICIDYEAGSAFDQLGQPDSAIARYRRFLEEPRVPEGRFQFANEALVSLRLAELYDAKADRANATKFYARLLQLWANADPHLQPRVEAARRRLGELTAER